MISRTQGYHSGFNFGFNIAEAVNFALPSWLKVANYVSACKCVKDSVHFNMGSFIRNVKQNDSTDKLNVKLPKTVEFEKSIKHYSENLHSYKNTPLNIKVSPTRTP